MTAEPTHSDDLPHVDEELAGWGNYPRTTCRRYRPGRVSALPHVVTHAAASSLLARGRGRSYGDAALNRAGGIIDTCPLDRFLDLDSENGILRAEAGVTVGEVLNVIVPRGWFLPVVPGTRFPTLGGLLAADVHGKNHHQVGSFQNHVRSATLLLASGETRVCSRSHHPDLFAATAGGMGLTGVITELEIDLHPVQSSFVRVREEKAPDLETVMTLLEEGDRRHQYSVAWIDGFASGGGLGRGTVLLGDHAFPADLGPRSGDPLQVPRFSDRPPPPGMKLLLGNLAVRAFNALRYWKAPRSRESVTDYASYFFPLDGMRDWNSLYGKSGFVQYQCVTPLDSGHTVLQWLLTTLLTERHPAYLVVLKRFGAGHGMLSFPTPGWTIALDIPVRPGLLPLLDRLDQRVIEEGGRVYLAKDARLARAAFRAMYSQIDEFMELKREVDPADRFTSDLARRLGLLSTSSDASESTATRREES